MYWGWVKNHESFYLNFILFSDCFREFKCLGDGNFPSVKKLISELLDASENQNYSHILSKNIMLDAY